MPDNFSGCVYSFRLDYCVLFLLHGVSFFNRDFVFVLLLVHSRTQLSTLDSHSFVVVWRIYLVQRTFKYVMGKVKKKLLQVTQRNSGCIFVHFNHSMESCAILRVISPTILLLRLHKNQSVVRVTLASVPAHLLTRLQNPLMSYLEPFTVSCLVTLGHLNKNTMTFDDTQLHDVTPSSLLETMTQRTAYTRNPRQKNTVLDDLNTS